MTGLPAPAPPILASDLLHSPPRNRHGEQHERARENAPWDLSKDIEEGVSCLPENSILSCGRVIGISGLRSSTAKGHGSVMEDNIQTWVDEFSLHILTALLANYPPSTLSSRAFVIQYFDSRPISAHDLYPCIQQRLPNHSPEDIESIIESAQIRRVYDFDELLEAVSQVSDILFELKQERDEEKQDLSSPVLLLIEGIDQSLEEIIRASNALAGHARLIPLLRTLTVLSRTYPSFLSVVLVNSISLPPIPPNQVPDQNNAQQQSTQSTSYYQQTETASTLHHSHHKNQQQPQQQYHPSLSVRSIFTPLPRQIDNHSPGFSTSSVLSSYYSPLARSLDQGFDVHILVSRVKGKMVIEVAKDRVGDGFGRWCVF